MGKTGEDGGFEPRGRLMGQSAAEFWRRTERYHPLAEQFEKNVERAHPPSVTSEGMCICLNWVSYCGWAASSVDYYEYRGPSV